MMISLTVLSFHWKTQRFNCIKHTFWSWLSS